jgi:PAS domain S-box-containing protein
MDLTGNATQKPYGIYLAIAASTVAVLLVDTSFKVGIVVGMLYVIPVTLTLWTNHWRSPIYLALLLTPIMVLGFFLKPPGDLEIAIINRPIVHATVYFVSLLCAFQLRTIAERKKAEAEVRSSEEKYRTIFETLSEGIMTSDTEGNLALANRAVVEMLGYTSEKELCGKPALQIYPNPETRTRLSELLRKEGRFKNLEVDFKKADGSTVPVLLSGVLQKDKDGNWAGFLGIFRDMTEMKKVQEAIRNAAAYNRSLLEASLDPMLTISPEGIVTDVNLAMEKATGADRGEMVGSPFENYIVQKALAIKGYQAVFKEGSLSNYELEIWNRSGERTPVMFNASIYRDDAGEVVGIIAAARDITKIKLYEEELRMHRNHLEEIVEERAAELRKANEELCVKDNAIRASSAAFAIGDLEGNLVYVNPSFLKLWGYSDEKEVLGHPILDFWHNKDLIAEVIGETQEKGYWTGELKGTRNDGERFICVANASLVLDEGGSPVGMASSFVEVTELRENEEKYRSVVERANDGIIVAQGRELVFANQAFASMSGYSVDEIIGMGFLEFVPNELHSKIADQVRRRLSGENVPASYEIDLLRKDGTKFSVEVNAGVIEYRGAPADLVILRDFSERKKIEHQVRERMKELQAFYNLAEITEREHLTLDELYQDLTNILPNSWQYPEIAYARIIIGDSEFRTKNFTESAWKQSTPVKVHGSVVGRIEVGYLEERPELNEGPFLKEERRLIGVIAERIGQITEHIKAEEALKQKTLELDGFFTNSLDLLAIADADGYFRRMNKEWESVLGFPVSELEGHKFLELVHPDDVNATIAIVSGMMSGKNALDFINRYRCKDGSYRWIKWRSFATGNIIYASARDITQSKLAEKALQEKTEDLTRSNEELEQFAYVASHDLQEPLRMISSYLQLLDKRYKGKIDKDADEFIFYAVDGAQRLQTMINDLLQYSRVKTRGKAFTTVDMNAVMNDVLNNLMVAIDESGTVVLSNPLPTVLADEAQMIMLLQNLVGNAIKYRKKDEKPLISVSVVSSGEEWVFSVKDNGIGIEPAYHDRIFRIFQRLNPRSEYEGTGMGLAIAKRIVDRHRGRIWLESELGKGSVFFYSIAKTGGN